MSLAPHPTIEGHYREPEQRQEYVDALFDSAAPALRLDLPRDVAGLGRPLPAAGAAAARSAAGHAASWTWPRARGWWRARRSRSPAASGVIGLDPSRGMLGRGAAHGGARRSSRRAARRSPSRAARFDALSMGYALRHVSDLLAAFREYHRVLRPGGRVLILEISRPGLARPACGSRAST